MEDQEEEKGGEESSMVQELNKDEGKMFIFANTFELLHSRLQEGFDPYPLLQVLEYTA